MMKTMSTLKISLLLLLPFALSSAEIKPNLDYSVQDKYLKQLHPIFPNLSDEERQTDWGREYHIGLCFAKELDLYQAITAFKRADILIPNKQIRRKTEIQYQIINAYYLGKKYQEVIETYEESSLANTDRNFLAFHDLLVILHDCYLKCDNPDRAKWIIHMADKFYPELAKRLDISGAITKADFEKMEKLSHDPEIALEIAALETKVEPYKKGFILTGETLEQFNPADEQRLEELQHLSQCQQAAQSINKHYQIHKKSPFLAAGLNAILPGAGYLYIGQAQSAFTSLCINSLFIAASTHFFLKGSIAAGILTSSFEMGWYLGGIIGAQEGAKYYNEKLYESQAHYRMRDHKLFPVLMLRHGF